MRNGGDILDGDDFQTSGLECTDSGLTALTGTLNEDFHSLQTTGVNRSLRGSFCSGLGSEGGRLTGATEAQSAGGSPGQGVAFQDFRSPILLFS